MVGSDELEGLSRASSQRAVLLVLVEHGEPMTSQDISEHLDMSVNAINIALYNLNNKGLVDRINRGVYKYKLGPLLVPLLRDFWGEE
ncbi:MAG: helix-turn-helix domain-containing protein [Candidatus Bathyarchaeia archaeon]